MPEPAERTSFVLAASLVLALLFWQWRPVGGTVWNLPGPGAGALWAAYAAGWAVAISSTFLISHSDLFGCGRPGCMRGTSGTAPRHSPSAACTGVSGIR